MVLKECYLLTVFAERFEIDSNQISKWKNDF